MSLLELLFGNRDDAKSQRPQAPAKLPGRNDACWCGSGKKYKHCHQLEDEMRRELDRQRSCTTFT